MKRHYITLIFITFFTLTFVPNTFAQDTVSEYVLRVVYFVPKDRVPDPNMDTKLDTMVKDIQKFYADEMERHGFGSKTFKFETDENGNVKVHQVKGIHNDADYISNNRFGIEEIEDQFNLVPYEFKNIYLIVFDYSNERVEQYGRGSVCGIGSGSSIGGFVKIPASGPCFNFEVIAHELGHTFGLKHDFRRSAFMMSYGRYRNQLSQCAAEWLDVHRYFNLKPEDVNWNLNVEMLTPSLASPPANIRLRFEVTDLDGLHQAQLQVIIGEGFSLIACQRLSGQRAIAEFVTDDLLGVDVIEIKIIDVHGNDQARRFTIDITDLLPPSEAISIPDPSFASAIRRSLKLEPNAVITQLDMLKLTLVGDGYTRDRPSITDITGVEHAKNARVINFYNNQISDITLLTSLTELPMLWLGHNQISDITPLTGLKQLEELSINSNQISDITPLIGLTQLQILGLSGNPILDYSPLITLTQLVNLSLYGNQISDVSLFAELKNLTSLGLGNNQISDISPLTELDNLENLVLDTNQISDVNPLANLTKLKDVFLGDNEISDVSPLAELTNLRILLLEDNEISDVSPLAELTNLRILHLGDNEISDASPLTELVNLEELWLVGNPIKNRQPLLDLLQKNPNVKIYLKSYSKPLPVTLSHFQAEHTDVGVILKWTTESELDNAGFNIYRSPTKDGEFKVVNPTMIQGAGTTGERNEYTWTDTTAKPNTVYYYRIEDVSHAGVRKQLRTVRLRGLISASGKLATSWAGLKAQN